MFMLSYRILSLVSCLTTFSILNLIGELLVKKFGKENDVKVLKYTKAIFLILSLCMFVWLLFNKELFHWNFDIATGEPVDHYSTYEKCIAFISVAIISNAVSCIIAKKRKM